MADASANADDGAEPQITFKVKTSGDRNHTITMPESATVQELKDKLAGDDFEKVPAEHQRLIYSGRVMKNPDPLSVYKIKPGNTVHLVKSAASNRAAASANTAASASGAASTPAVPANMAAGTSASNLMEGLTGARFAGHVPLPSADLFGPDGGMAAPPSEEELADLLSNPAMAATLNEALSNPNVVDYLIQSNPMLRGNPQARQIVQSPQFRQMMTDPESLRMAGRLRRMMGGGQDGAAAFPAPGATDSTPEGAPASGTAAPPPPNPFALFNPALFGAMPAAAPGAAAQNPFAALFAPPPPAAPQQGDASQAPGAPPPPPPAAAAAANQFNLTPEMMEQMLRVLGGPGAGGLGAGGLGAGGLGNLFGGAAAAAAPADNRPPEERYAEQLRQLNDMGFFDFDANVAALRRSGGSVQGAIEHLLNN